MPGGWPLIVEDDAGLARTVAQVLRAVGVSAVECADGVPAALALFSRPAPVAALVNLGLPGGHGSGVDLAVELRRQHPEPDIVVWIGADDIALVHEAHAARFDFITKAPGVELPRDRARRWDRLAREELHGRGDSRAPCAISVDLHQHVVQRLARRRHRAERPRRGSSVSTDATASTQAVVVVAHDPLSTQRRLLAQPAKKIVVARGTGAPRPMTDTVTTQSVHGLLSVPPREPRPSTALLEARRPR